MPVPTPGPDEGHQLPEGSRYITEILASNVRAIRRRRYWDKRYQEWGGDRLSAEQDEQLQQSHVAERMNGRGHSTWTQQTVSDVERGRRNVTVAELLSLVLVLGSSIGDLLDPAGPDQRAGARIALDLSSDLDPLDSEQLGALVCGHELRATVVWRGPRLLGIEYEKVEQ